jgi:hypothetical protein
MFPELSIKEGWVTVFLMLLVLLIVAWSIQATGVAEGLYVVQGVVVVGGFLGILLAKSRVPRSMAHALSILAGISWTGLLTSRILGQELGLPVEEAVAALTHRVGDWVLILFSEQRGFDNYVYILILAFLLWIMAYFCAWAVFRWQRVWWAVIVCGVVLMLNATYAPDDLTLFLIAYLLFSLLLVVRTNIAEYEHEWRLAKVGYSPELVYSFLRAGLVVSVVAILLAWLAPAALASRPMQPFWDRVGEPWRELQSQWTRLFYGLDYQNEATVLYFPRSVKFGGAVELTDRQIMDIRAPLGRYWRVMVFQEYTGDGWDNTDLDTVLLDEYEQGLVVPDFEYRREVTQTITLKQNMRIDGAIAAAGQPIRAGVPIRALVSSLEQERDSAASRDDSAARTAPGDASVFYSQVPLYAGDTYQVVSSITQADQESLRQAGTDYPAWVVPRYLQLPDSVPDRIRILAEQITEGLEASYDKAAAIERYLRQIPYNEQIDEPGPGQDGVDYFLFDVREGYCDYYASSMVVMLRSLGVPARYVRGYGQGERQVGVYEVREWDSHAWPEVFFPGYGWVEFEPTGGEPALVRPASRNDGAGALGPNRDQPEPDRRSELLDLSEPGVLGSINDIPGAGSFGQLDPRWWWLALDLALAVPVVIALLMARRRRQIEGLSVAERVYFDLVGWVRRLLRIGPLSHQTPYEYAGVVGQAMPTGREAVTRIAGLYVEERFGGKIVSDQEAEVAWQEARPALWKRWLQFVSERIRAIPRKLLGRPLPDPEWRRMVSSSEE